MKALLFASMFSPTPMEKFLSDCFVLLAIIGGGIMFTKAVGAWKQAPDGVKRAAIQGGIAGAGKVWRWLKK